MERTKPLTWAFYDALNDHMVAMRTDEWKIMCRLKSDTTYLDNFHNIYDGNEAFVKEADLTDFVLYNMKEDTGEAENVASKYPDIFEEMKAQLLSEYADLLEGSFVWKRN
jgi:arylsulfatase A